MMSNTQFTSNKRDLTAADIALSSLAKKLCRDNGQVVPKIEDDTSNDSHQSSSSASSSFTTFSSSQDKLSLFNIEAPRPGTVVSRKTIKRAGSFILGPELGQSPVHNSHRVQCLARKEGTDQFYQLKILQLTDHPTDEKIKREERHGKMLMHTEFCLLSHLGRQEGVIQQHGIFTDYAFEEEEDKAYPGVFIYTGNVIRRLILILDCVSEHGYDDKSSAYIDLQRHVIQEKRLHEKDALMIIYQIIKVVVELHNKNIVHRDLKLGNIILNRRTFKVTITNFGLGKYLVNEDNLLHDQRGSPAYISPDVVSGQPYKGKPSDMWALGVVLFTMIYGQFPFYDTTPAALFKRIKIAHYDIPSAPFVTPRTQDLIRSMLQLNPNERATAVDVKETIEAIICLRIPREVTDQCVPEINLIPKKYAKNKKEQRKELQPSAQPFKKQRYAFSQLLEMTPDKSSKFLRPNSLSVQKIDRDARPLTQNELGQFQHIIHNNSNRLNNSIWPRFLINNNNNSSSSSNNNNSSNGNTNSAGNSNSGTNSLQISNQMQNLSIRNRHDIRMAPLSWVNIRSTLPIGSRSDQVPNIQRIIRGNIPNADSESSSSSDDTLTSRYRSNAIVPRSTEVQDVFFKLGEIYFQGRMPRTATSRLREFNGYILGDLAQKLCNWLSLEFDVELIRDVIITSTASNVEKLTTLLRRCGVLFSDTSPNSPISRDQSLDSHILMCYLLQAAGYNNSYFLR